MGWKSWSFDNNKIIDWEYSLLVERFGFTGPNRSEVREGMLKIIPSNRHNKTSNRSNMLPATNFFPAEFLYVFIHFVVHLRIQIGLQDYRGCQIIQMPGSFCPGHTHFSSGILSFLGTSVLVPELNRDIALQCKLIPEANRFSSLETGFWSVNRHRHILCNTGHWWG